MSHSSTEGDEQQPAWFRRPLVVGGLVAVAILIGGAVVVGGDDESDAPPAEPTVDVTSSPEQPSVEVTSSPEQPSVEPTESPSPPEEEVEDSDDDRIATCNRLFPLLSGWNTRFARASNASFDRLAQFMTTHAGDVESIVRKSRLPRSHKVLELASAVVANERAFVSDLAVLVANQSAYEKAFNRVLKPLVRLELNACSPVS